MNHGLHHSFDIFDTVLTRRLSCPIDVFSILDARLMREGIRRPPMGLFRVLRVRCERWSRRLEPSYEVLLPDIYHLLGKFLFWTEKQRQRAAQIEREIECEMLCATPFGLAAVRQAREQGRKVAFVSDMYLDSLFLREILEREGIAQEEDCVAVSGEWKASKAGEKIWPILLEKLRIAPEQLLHQGDHPHSDVASPARFGIASRRIGTSVVSRWEQWQSRRSPLSAEQWGSIAALSRMARASCEEPDGYWAQLGTGTLGPLITGFLAWLIQRAKRDGITTLWFLSRDAWLFYQAALIVCPAEGLDFRYIGINRNQLRFALEGARPLEELYAGTRRVTWHLVSERLHFSAQDMAQVREAMGQPNNTADQVLGTDMRDALLALLRSEEWTQRREKRAAEAGHAARAYLAQESVGASGIGIVDVGWVGRSQDMLSQLCPIVKQGYYLGLSHAKPQEKKAAWLYDIGARQGASELNSFQRMIEALIGSESGPLEGYREQDGRWVPQFSAMNSSESTPGREKMHQAAMEFVKLSTVDAYRNWWCAEDMLVVARHNMRQLLEHPEPRDLRAFEPWQVTTDDAHQDSVMPAQGFDRKRLSQCLAKKEPWGLIWPQAAWNNSPGWCRAIIKTAWFFKNRA